MKSQCIFIAAGGTGGHIYPGLALAAVLKQERPELEILFVGTRAGLENTLVGQKGYTVLHLPIGRLNSNVPLKERIKTVLSLPLSFVKAVSLLIKYKPSCVVGIGGHASGPMLLMASLLRTPTVIWEPNAMPGMANRFLSPFVSLACIVFEEARARLKSKNFMIVGMPLRKEIENLYSEAPVKTETKDKLNVFVFGGSQGALGVNSTMVKAVKDFAFQDDFEIIHQTGKSDFERTKLAYGDFKVDVRPYIEDMPELYRWADVIVCRSGAGTLAELAAVGKPAVLIPFPYSSDDHQQKNAEAFSNENAAITIRQKDLTPQLLRETLLKLKTDPVWRKTLGSNVRKMYVPKAAEAIATRILELGDGKF